MESSHESDSSSVSKDSERLRIKKLPVAVILLVELCERLTYYTLAGTQKIYFQNQLQKTPSTSAALNSVFSMLCYFWCIPGGASALGLCRATFVSSQGVIRASFGHVGLRLSCPKSTSRPLVCQNRGLRQCMFTWFRWACVDCVLFDVV